MPDGGGGVGAGEVAVGGTEVGVGPIGVLVGGSEVAVGVFVGGSDVEVGVGVAIGLWAETGKLNSVPTSNIKRAKTDKTRLVFMEFLLASGSPLESVAFDYKLESAKSGCRFGYNTVTFHPIASMVEPESALVYQFSHYGSLIYSKIGSPAAPISFARIGYLSIIPSGTALAALFRFPAPAEPPAGPSPVTLPSSGDFPSKSNVFLSNALIQNMP